jgi:multidrug efflux pump subunit AcrA (membrane-fusion protein)
MADARTARGRRRRRLVAGATAGALVVCLAGAGLAWAALRPQTPGYRLATATKSDVSQTAALAGTVASAGRADRAFQLSGTVASVAVKVGDRVTAGQTLATLDTSTLDAEVTAAQQAVTSAQQQLDDDLASQTAGASTSTADDSAAASAPGGSGTALAVFAASAPAGSGDTAQLAKAVTDAQSTLLTDAGRLQAIGARMSAELTSLHDSTLTQLSGTLAAVAADPGCAAITAPAATPTAAQVEDCSAVISTALTAVNAALATTGSASSGSPATVTDALGALGDELEQLATLQNTTLPADEKALDAAVTALSEAVTSAPSGSGAGSGSASGAPQGGSGSGASGAGGSASTGSSRTGGSAAGTSGSAASGSGSARSGGTGSGASAAATPASAQQIVADQASLAAAQANLAVAQQNLGLATLTSPIAGTVAAVGVAAGSSVTARSSSQVISVIGGSGWVVDTAVTAGDVGPLKVGQAARVDVSGVSGAVRGTVASVGFLDTSTDSSTPSYDVAIALSSSAAGLLDGSSARLTVAVDKARHVLTVPVSALHLGTGNRYSVDVVAGGKAQTRTVTVGAIGSDRAEITRGLSAGDRVALADLSSTVSSDSTATTTGGRFAREASGTAVRFGTGTGTTGRGTGGVTLTPPNG